MMLWFPALVAGAVQTGLSLQRRLSTRGVPIKKFGYRQALGLTPTSIFIWLAVTGVGVCSTLVVTYPENPTSFEGWLLITCPWMPLWFAIGWIREHASNHESNG
jgi:hypothetical protein